MSCDTCKMSAKMLKNARKRMGLGVGEMAAYLGWAYRTYQDREAGKFAISKEAAEEVLAAEKHLSESMKGLFVKLKKRIESDFPDGIQSTIE